MKHTLHDFTCRTFFYVLAYMFLNTAFGSWPDFPTAVPYFVHYGPQFLLSIAVCETAFQIARHFIRRTPPAPPVPDTQHLQPPDARTTTHLDIKH